MDKFTVGTSEYKLIRVSSGTFNFDIQGHAHGDRSYELHYVYGGKGILETEDKIFNLKADTLYVNGPSVWHRQTVCKDDPLAEVCINIQLEKAGSDLLSHFFNATRLYCAEGNETLRQLFLTVSRLHGQNDIFSKEKEKSCIQIIITTLSELYAPNTAATEGLTIDEEKFYIIDVSFLYDYAKLNLESLADRLGISPRQTQRLLQRHYGKTFRQKKKEAQTEAALLMLKQGKSVNEVSLLAGYSDTPSFIRAFKSVYGKSPTQAAGKH